MALCSQGLIFILIFCFNFIGHILQTCSNTKKNIGNNNIEKTEQLNLRIT